MPRILRLVLKQHSHNPSSLKTVHRTVLSTLTFSPDLAVNLDKKENRVVKDYSVVAPPTGLEPVTS